MYCYGNATAVQIITINIIIIICIIITVSPGLGFAVIQINDFAPAYNKF